MRKNPSNFIGKVPPQAVELEEAVLGALMLEQNSLVDVLDILSVDCFYKESHKVIFKSIIELFSKSEPIDLLTVTQSLRKNGTLEIAGGAFYVTELTSKVGSCANIEYHSRIIFEQYLKRELIRISGETQQGSFEDTSDVFDLIGNLENSLMKISTGISSGSVYQGIELVMDSINRIKNKSKQKDGITGITSGYQVIDKITGGWQNSDLIILAARPAMGKTDLAINLALNGARNGFKCALFSLEMSKEQLMERALALECDIEREKIKFGTLDSSDWLKISTPNEKTFKNFIIADEPSLTTISFKSKARRLKIQQKIDMIIIDYLQLMQSLEKGSTNDKVSDISRTLKLIAKELNIPIIALSQLSRSVETRGGDKRPMLSDLRDSGAIEQDADIVIFPYRPIYYGISERNDGTDCKQLMEIDFAKNRSGAVDTVDLKYLGKYGKITNFKDLEPFQPIKEIPEQSYKFNSNGLNDFDSKNEPLPF
jgi:replicative DNA helicase